MKVLSKTVIVLFLLAGTVLGTPEAAQPGDPVDASVVHIVNELLLSSSPLVVERRIVDEGLLVVVVSPGSVFTLIYDSKVVSVDGKLTVIVRPNNGMGFLRKDTFVDFGLDGVADDGGQSGYNLAIRSLNEYLSSVGS